MSEEVQVVAAETPETPQVASEPQEPQTDTPEGEKPQEPQEKRKDGGFQRRIDKLVREKSEREREAEFWKAEALKHRQPEAKPEAAVSDAEPDPNKFDTQADYIKALTKYNVELARKDFIAQQREEQEKVKKEAVVKEFHERTAKFKETVPDFDEVLADSDAPVSPALIEEMNTHEHGPALMYFLAQNPDEAERLSALPPLALARAVARLESKFVPSAQAETKPVAAVSKAPKPPTPVSRSAQTATKDPGEMSPAEYREWRAKTFPNL